MDVPSFLNQLEQHPGYQGQLVHVRVLEPSAGSLVPLQGLPSRVAEVLRAVGIKRLYEHQHRAWQLVQQGRHVVVRSGTASGKSLCYHLPMLQHMTENPRATALYLFPTKALTQDQLKSVQRLLEQVPGLLEQVFPGVYDGDTPGSQRRRIRTQSRLVLTNPDMLHAALLPYHAGWARFFAQLKLVVLDEAHVYRGIFGAHVAQVLRRLRRILDHYGTQVVFVATSATIANPGQLLEQLVGEPFEVIEQDAAPRGRKFFAFWNPPPAGPNRLWRRSVVDEAVMLTIQAMQFGAQVLTFARTRQQAELIYRYVRQYFQQRGSELADQIRAYRGGYLPLERRQIEQELFSGHLRAVAATNALELGIDVGALDVVLLAGYPGTISSTWQQAGRSGRRGKDSLAVLIAGNDPLDQFLVRNPDYFFSQEPEHAVVDPENPHIASRHLAAAAYELPLEEQTARSWGRRWQSWAKGLADQGVLWARQGRYFYHGPVHPARQISLRHIGEHTFSVVVVPPGPGNGLVGTSPAGPPGPSHPMLSPPPNAQVIATVDEFSAPELIYPQAIYLHQGQSYLVRHLDWEGKIAYVEPVQSDYYTQAIVESAVFVQQQQRWRQTPQGDRAGCAQVQVRWKTTAFKKIKFHTRENVGWGSVSLPQQELCTQALWLCPGLEVAGWLRAQGYRLPDALAGVRNLATVALPLVAMSDPSDIGAVVDFQNFGQGAVILYDRYPGGLGYCHKGFELLPELLRVCWQVVQQCPCRHGCPSCVGLSSWRPAQFADPELTGRQGVPDKRATMALLEKLCQRPWQAPQVAEPLSA